MIAKLESFVRRLTEDELFRQSAIKNPERAVDLFGLTGPERHGALQLCAQVATPNSLVTKPAGVWF